MRNEGRNIGAVRHLVNVLLISFPSSDQTTPRSSGYRWSVGLIGVRGQWAVDNRGPFRIPGFREALTLPGGSLASHATFVNTHVEISSG